MPSKALIGWQTTSAVALDQIEAAHAALGGTGPGRRFATEQVNHAYTVLLASQFQRFCRDLHSEAADRIAAVPAGSAVRAVFLTQLNFGRQLDRGNANPATLGADFGRFDLELWNRLIARDRRNRARQLELERLNRWRNAIAHQHFDPSKLGSSPLWLSGVRRWRRACNGLSRDMDLVVAVHLRSILGVAAW
jgi:hypothetical protein